MLVCWYTKTSLSGLPLWGFTLPHSLHCKFESRGVDVFNNASSTLAIPPCLVIRSRISYYRQLGLFNPVIVGEASFLGIYQTDWTTLST